MSPSEVRIERRKDRQVAYHQAMQYALAYVEQPMAVAYARHYAERIRWLPELEWPGHAEAFATWYRNLEREVRS